MPSNINLARAAKTGNMDDLLELQKAGANFNQRGMWDSTPLISACQYCNPSAALFIIGLRGVEVDCRNERGATPLLLSSMEGMTRVVEALLDHDDNLAKRTTTGVVYNSKTDVNSCLSPLLAASTNGHEDIVRILIEHGADVNEEIPVTTGCRLTAVLAAAQHGHTSIVELLINNGAVLSHTSPDGSTPLLMACRYGHSSTADFLLSKINSDTICKVDDDGKNVLHWCAEHGLDKVCRKILSRNVIDVNDRDKREGRTALFVACFHKNFYVVKALLENQADTTTRNFAGVAPQDLVAANGDEDIANLLVKASATCIEEGRKGMMKEECSRVKFISESRSASPVTTTDRTE